MDQLPVAQRPLKKLTRKFVTCARMGDKIAAPARARLIWAAQTAQATRDLGLDSLLVGGAARLPFRTDTPDGYLACKRYLQTLYNVAADFDLQLLFPSAMSAGDAKWKRSFADGGWEAFYEMPRYVLPHAGMVHTRDPRVVAACLDRNIDVIYEDHEEDFHVAVEDPVALGLNKDRCVAVVAITESVRQRLVARGVEPSRIIVMDSGVNPRALDRRTTAAESWRRFLLQDGHSRVIVYTGGMQVERGIEHLIQAATEMPDCMFVFAGGNEVDNRHWIEQAKVSSLSNTRFFGYCPQSVVCELQQAADVLVMTRLAGQRTEITSPLKFFEYLAAGTPVVAARISVLESPRFDDLALRWYSPLRAGELASQLRNCMEDHPRLAAGYQANRDVARDYLWTRRQAEILKFAGVALPEAGANPFASQPQ